VDIKRDGERTSLREVRRATLVEALQEASDKRIPARVPPHSPNELARALRQVLGRYLTARELTPFLRGTTITVLSVRKGGAVRWVQVGRNFYYCAHDIRELLRSR
jgi:hypothetical protein